MRGHFVSRSERSAEPDRAEDADAEQQQGHDLAAADARQQADRLPAVVEHPGQHHRREVTAQDPPGRAEQEQELADPGVSEQRPEPGVDGAQPDQGLVAQLEELVCAARRVGEAADETGGAAQVGRVGLRAAEPLGQRAAAVGEHLGQVLRQVLEQLVAQGLRQVAERRTDREHVEVDLVLSCGGHGVSRSRSRSFIVDAKPCQILPDRCNSARLSGVERVVLAVRALVAGHHVRGEEAGVEELAAGSRKRRRRRRRSGRLMRRRRRMS
nr:hypothetical protein GCM10020092_097760 [Actinoplanes digitatis]